MSRAEFPVPGLSLVLLAQILGAAWIDSPKPAVITWGERIQRWALDGKAPVTLSGRKSGAG